MNGNAKIVQMLQRVLALKRQQLSEMPRATTPELKKQKQGRRFGISAISRAIEEILASEVVIRDGQTAMQLPGIGKGIAARIDEFLSTGKLKELEGFKTTGDTTELQTVFGVGPSQARKLLDDGISTVAQLRLAVTSGHLKASDPIMKGLLYHRDLQTRIPRYEMDYYKSILHRIKAGLGKSVKLDLLGSYRRKLPDCGDLDVLVTSKSDPTRLLNTFLLELEKRRMLVAHLGEGETKFTGIILHPRYGIARRIDVRYVPYESYPTALLYFTGSKDFNVMMRRQAIGRGLKLSEYSLITSDGTMIHVESEKDIFAALKVPYVKPEQR